VHWETSARCIALFTDESTLRKELWVTRAPSLVFLSLFPVHDDEIENNKLNRRKGTSTIVPCLVEIPLLIRQSQTLYFPRSCTVCSLCTILSYNALDLIVHWFPSARQ
jgi:hypothetical protein